MSAWMAAAVLAAAPLPVAPQDAAQVGDVPQYQFREALINGQGTKSLADLAGRPVLVEFWGTR